MGSTEHAVDVSCRGLRLGVSLTLAEVGPTTGFIEIGQPLPVGSEVTLAAGALEIHGRVMRVREAVEGRAAGMIVSVSDLDGEAKAWWDGQVTSEDPIPLSELEAPPAPEGAAAAASSADSEVATETQVATGSEPAAATDSEAAADSEPASDADSAPETEAGTAPEAEAKADSETAADAEPEPQTEFEAADTEVDTGTHGDPPSEAPSNGVPAGADEPGGSNTAMMDATAIAAIEADATGSDAEHAERAAEAAAAGVDDASNADAADETGDGERSGTNSEESGRGKRKGRRRRRRKR